MILEVSPKPGTLNPQLSRPSRVGIKANFVIRSPSKLRPGSLLSPEVALKPIPPNLKTHVLSLSFLLLWRAYVMNGYALSGLFNTEEHEPRVS